MKALTSFFNSFGLVSETYRHLQKARQKNANISDLKIQWAQNVLARLKVQLKITGQVSDKNSLLFVGNHISYLDIAILFATIPGCSFVAKKELSYWPIFGATAKEIETVFVKRENKNSRRAARQAVKTALQNGQRIVLFPSGTTCLDEDRSWRKGAFEIAHEIGCPIQPFRLSFKPLRPVAYIDRDFFPLHLFNLFQLGSIEAHIEFHDPVAVQNPQQDCSKIQNWTRQKSQELKYDKKLATDWLNKTEHPGSALSAN